MINNEVLIITFLRQKLIGLHGFNIFSGYFFIGLIGLIRPIGLISLISPIGPIGLIGPIRLIALKETADTYQSRACVSPRMLFHPLAPRPWCNTAW